jgi:putative restriction endonuclease
VAANLDSEFLECLECPDFREELRRQLIEHYFVGEERRALYGLTGIEPAGEGTTDLPPRVDRPRKENDARREASFRLRVLPAYNYTCALTGYRMVSTDGKTAVDAAHIMQFKKGGPNIPSNGIALSKTAHWLFDRGFWSIANDFHVLVKEDEFEETGTTAHLLKERRHEIIRLPDRKDLRPASEFLAWHRKRHGFLS